MLNPSCVSRVLRRAWLALACVLAGALAAHAQGRGAEAQVRAYLSSNVVRLGDRVALIVAVENARSADIAALPSVAGLAIGPLGQPSQQSYVEIVNGRRSSSVSSTWAIPLRPADVGEYVIPPFDVLVDGVARKTAELRLNVFKDMRGEDLGFLEIRPSSKRVIVGQPFSLEMVFGFDAAISDKTSYLNLALSWWGNLPGVLENQAPAANGARRGEIYLNERGTIEIEQVANRKLRDREFVALRVVRSFTPTREGTLEIPVSFFEFGSVVERRDFFSTRREKGETFFARAPELTIQVVPLPETGRPVDFGGAIGTLAARADATPRDVDAGDSIKLKVEWTGEGNLEFFTPPDIARLESFRDFRVYGRTEEKAFDRRTVVYDISPVTSQAREIPAVPLSVYDPQSERYVSVKTEPIPIRVRALEGASGLGLEAGEERFKNDVRDIVLQPSPRGERAPLGAAFVFGFAALLPAGWLALRGFVRRNGDPDAPRERARRKARKMLARSLARAGDARAQLESVYQFLSARSGESVESWIGRRVCEAVAGGDVERLRGLDTVIGELEASVWGGTGAARERERVLTAADEALRGGL
ncbi:MAG: BatD family protein [Planctomycetes bacterium]|nr:BatD family protein [Planctomycetota bacterium]